MKYIKLGATGLDVSSTAIGAMTYGERDRGHPVWSRGEEEARPLIRRAGGGDQLLRHCEHVLQRLQ